MMTTCTTKRAAKGGEFGANGEWYEGGKFINTVPENRKKEGSNRRGTGKQEIAPYVWEVPPEGMHSLFRQISGIFGKYVDGRFILDGSDRLPIILRHIGRTKAEAVEMIEAYNSGVRWIRW